MHIKICTEWAAANAHYRILKISKILRNYKIRRRRKRKKKVHNAQDASRILKKSFQNSLMTFPEVNDQK
jgi:hypothetical protein